MTQHFFIVNIDKKEFLNPLIFGNDEKIDDIISNAVTMVAISLLIFDGNGKGKDEYDNDNDIAYTTSSNMGARYLDFVDKDEEKVKEWKEIMLNSGLKVSGINDFGKERHYTLIPIYSGRWVGDRIVYAGSHGEKGKYIKNDRVLTNKELEILNPTKEKDVFTLKDINLYEHCLIGNFTDISKEVLK